MKDLDFNYLSYETIQAISRIPNRPHWLWKIVFWLRRKTGRDRYYIGVDSGTETGSISNWCLARRDVVTGMIVIEDMGEGDVPSKYKDVAVNKESI